MNHFTQPQEDLKKPTCYIQSSPCNTSRHPCRPRLPKWALDDDFPVKTMCSLVPRDLPAPGLVAQPAGSGLAPAAGRGVGHGGTIRSRSPCAPRGPTPPWPIPVRVGRARRPGSRRTTLQAHRRAEPPSTPTLGGILAGRPARGEADPSGQAAPRWPHRSHRPGQETDTRPTDAAGRNRGGGPPRPPPPCSKFPSPCRVCSLPSDSLHFRIETARHRPREKIHRGGDPLSG